MSRKPKKLEDHFDGDLSPLGVVIALVMVTAGIGSLIAFSSRAYWLGIPLVSVFVLILIVLTVVACRTDTNLRMTKAERMDRWKSMPTFAKVSLYIMTTGAVVQLAFLLSGLRNEMRYFPFIFLAATLATLVLARGVQIEKPPIPRPNQPPLTIESEPEEYLKHVRTVVLSSYVAAFCTGAICILFLIG